MRVVVDLPFVPTTWTAGSPACGSPSSESSARIRSVPNPSRGQGDSVSSQSTFVMRALLGAECGRRARYAPRSSSSRR